MTNKKPKKVKISQESLSNYTADISSITNEATSAFQADIRTYIESKGDPSLWTKSVKNDIRDYVADSMSNYVDLYGTATQGLAARLNDAVLDAQDISVNTPIADINVSDRANQSSHYWASNLWKDTPDVETFINGCTSFVERHVRHASDYCLIDSAQHGKYKRQLRYARVPQGPSCGFCIMLASRGFVYLSEETAGAFNQWHNNCDCKVLGGFPGIEVEGYDYKGMYGRYKKCRDALGTPEDIYKDFEALSVEEQNKYGDGLRIHIDEMPESLVRKLGQNADAFNDYYMHRILEEIDKQDRLYMYNGTKLKGRLKYTGEMTEDDAIAYVQSNTQSKHVIKAKQDSHRGKAAEDSGRSVVSISDDEIEELVSKYAGTGNIRVNNQPEGTQQIKESITLPSGKIIGEWSNKKGTKSKRTNRLTIHYSDSGIHIVPARPSEVG